MEKGEEASNQPKKILKGGGGGELEVHAQYALSRCISLFDKLPSQFASKTNRTCTTLVG